MSTEFLTAYASTPSSLSRELFTFKAFAAFTVPSLVGEMLAHIAVFVKQREIETREVGGNLIDFFIIEISVCFHFVYKSCVEK